MTGAPAATPRNAQELRRHAVRPPPPPIWFGRVLAAFVRRQLHALSAYRGTFFMRAVSFAATVLALAFFSRFVSASQNPHLAAYGGNYLSFTLIGLIGMEVQQVAVSSMANHIRLAQMLGYLEAEIATPAPAWMVLGTAPIYELGVAALRSAGYLVLAALLFGIRFHEADWAAVAVAVPLVLAAFAGLGLLSAAATMLVRRTNPIALLLGATSMLLSGVLYPASVLPGWLQSVAHLLPLTHALEALRGALLLGRGPEQLLSALLPLAATAAVLIAAGLTLFVYALRRARIDGSLAHY